MEIEIKYDRSEVERICDTIDNAVNKIGEIAIAGIAGRIKHNNNYELRTLVGENKDLIKEGLDFVKSLLQDEDVKESFSVLVPIYKKLKGEANNETATEPTNEEANAETPENKAE